MTIENIIAPEMTIRTIYNFKKKDKATIDSILSEEIAAHLKKHEQFEYSETRIQENSDGSALFVLHFKKRRNKFFQFFKQTGSRLFQH